MAQVRVLTQRRRPPAQDIERWQARRRWARVGIVYTVMLIFSILFLGPLLFAALSSLREDPLEYSYNFV